MPNILTLTPGDVDSKDKRPNYSITVVGCGQKGISFILPFAEAGFMVTCSDADPAVAKKLAKGKTPYATPELEAKLKNNINSGQLTISTDLKKAVSKSDVVIVTLKPRIDEKKKPNYSEILAACKQIGAALQPGSLIVYADVCGVGFVEGELLQTLEDTSGLKAGVDFGLAYAPLCETAAELEFKVAGVGEKSLKAALTLFGTVSKNIKPINSIRTSEVATLFEVTKQDAKAAISNEMAVFCESAGADYFEVLEALGSMSHSCPLSSEEKVKDVSYLLLESAENLNAKLRIPALARQINEDMIKHAANLTQDALRDCGKALRRARVAVLGPANESTEAFVRILEQKGARVTVFDQDAKKTTMGSGVVKAVLNEATEGADCVVLLTCEDHIKKLNLKKLKALTKTPSALVDLAGVFYPQQVEANGFAYKGLGRGANQK